MSKRRRKATDRASVQRESPSAGHAASPALPPGRSGRMWLLMGVAALFVARPLFPTESAIRGDGLPVVMLWIALAVFWLLGAIGRPRWELRFGWVDAAVCALVAWHTLAGVVAAFTGSPRPAVNMTWEWLGMGLSFLLARQLVRTEREGRAIMAVMIALAVGLAGYGLYEYAVEMPAKRAAYAADPAAALREADWSFEPGTPQAKAFEDRLQSTEPLATFALTNSLAGYLAPWLLVLLGAVLLGIRGRRAMLFALLCAVPVAVCLMLTKSRSAYVASAVGFVLLGVTAWYGRRGRRVPWKWAIAAGIVLVVGFGVALVAGGLDRQVATEAGKSLGYRLQYWQSTLRMMADHPVLGCGPGNYQFAYTQYKLPEASEEVADPHNFLFEIGATAGIPAAVLFLVVIGGFFCCVWMRHGFPSSAEESGRSGDGRHERDGAWFVVAGGGVGFLLAVPLGWLSSAPPSLMSVLVGLPAAVAAVFLLSDWIRDGRLPRALPAIGVMVLLIHLLAAGALGFPGVSGTLWLLLAVGLIGGNARVAPRAAAFGALAFGLFLAVLCYVAAYEPVLQSNRALREARDAAVAGQPLLAEQRLREAAEADPLAAEPWRDLAELMLQTWEATGGTQALQTFREADAAAVRLEPNSATAWLVSGDWHLRVYRRNLARSDAQRAVASYEQAVRLYPNSGLCHARLALAYRVVGEPAQFAAAAEEALRLDRLTPHVDKKLPAALREELQRGLAAAP